MALWERERVTLVVEPDVIRFLGVLGGRVLRWGSMPIPRNTIEDGYVVNEGALAQALERLWSSQGLPNRPVPHDGIVLGIPGYHSKSRILDITGLDTRNVLLLNEKAAEILPDVENYRAWQVVGPKASPALFVVAAPVGLVDGYVASLQRAGLGAATVDTKPLALIRAVGSQQTVIVDGERDQAAILIVNEALLHYARFLPLDAPLLHAPEDKILRLGASLGAALQQYNSDNAATPHVLHQATPIFLTGLLADHPLLREVVQELLGHPIGRVAAPFTLPTDMPIAQFAANLGLAQKRI